MASRVEIDQTIYDSIFDAALEMQRIAIVEPKEPWGLCISELMFSVLNGWGRSEDFDPRVVGACAKVAEMWNWMSSEQYVQHTSTPTAEEVVA